MLQKSKEPRHWKKAILIGLEFLLLAGTGIVAAFLVEKSAYNSAISEVQRYQESRAQEVRNKIQSFLLSATQLAETLRILLENYQGSDRTQIEEYLQRIVESAPETLVYGAGAWYEPFRFEAQTKFFGPYVHRGQNPGERTLTYEWTTAEYNFPTQPWYQAGLSAKDHPVFTDPYWDSGLVYMTVAFPFYDRKQHTVRGVISIDMILPQLQELVNSINQRGKDVIYVVGSSNKLLAHPEEHSLIEAARALEPSKKALTLLDIPAEKALASIEKPLIFKTEVNETGWKIVVATPEQVALKSFHNMQLFLRLATLAYLIVISVSFIVIYILSERAQRLRERAFLHQNRHMEDQAKLLQLGELFSDLSHELKNIFHSNAEEETLREQDVHLSLAPLSLQERDRSFILGNIINFTYWQGKADRANQLDLDRQAPHFTSKRRLRGMIAQFKGDDAEVIALWNRLLALADEELIFLENQLRIMIHTQSLARSMSLGRELSLAVLSFVRHREDSSGCAFASVHQQVDRLIATRARKYPIVWTREIVDAKVLISQGHLLQILLNLLLNAIEAVGGLEREQQFITIKSQKNHQGLLEVRVENGGPIIPQETREKLFSRGFTTKGEKGSGIGLDVSRRLAQDAAGDLSYDASQDHPCFVLSLPCHAEDQELSKIS